MDFGFHSAAPPICADCVFPKVLALASDLRPGARILDIGCGNGYLAATLVRRGFHVVGLDLSETGIALARASCPSARFEILPADEKMLESLGEAPFDLVVSTELIEHLYAPGAFLRGACMALKPGGQLILSTPYHGYLKNAAIFLTGRFDTHFQAEVQGGHIKFWSRRTLSRALEAVGFRDLQFHGVGRIPFLWKGMVYSARRQD